VSDRYRSWEEDESFGRLDEFVRIESIDCPNIHGPTGVVQDSDGPIQLELVATEEASSLFGGTASSEATCGAHASPVEAMRLDRRSVECRCHVEELTHNRSLPHGSAPIDSYTFVQFGSRPS
jgi:hypothetical protein